MGPRGDGTGTEAPAISLGVSVCHGALNGVSYRLLGARNG